MATSAGFSRISAKSLYAHVSASVSPAACMRSHELYTITPGWVAPVTSTWVPSGSELEVHPSVSVAAPVPEQWAA